MGKKFRFGLFLLIMMTLGLCIPASWGQSPAPALYPTNIETSVNSYREIWAKKSVKTLEENGIKLPDTIRYGELITYNAFRILIARITTTEQKDLSTQEFSPSGNTDRISRGVAINMAIQAFGLGEALDNFKSEESRFKDITPAHPSYAAIVLAERTKLINGYPDQTIRPDEQLTWGETLILIETIYSWRKALPTDAPVWVRKYQKKINSWYQLIDGVRLLLTLIYAGFAMVFLYRSFVKSRLEAHSPYKAVSQMFMITTLVLLAMWINEMLFVYGLVPRELYQVLALLSILASLLVLRIGSYIDEKLSEPKPQAVIDVGYVDAVNLDKGELFIIDTLTRRRVLAMMHPDTKIFNQDNNLLTQGFLSEIKEGNFINIKGSSRFAGTVIDVDKMLLISQNNQEMKIHRQKQLQQIEQAEKQLRYNRVLRRPAKE